MTRPSGDGNTPCGQRQIVTGRLVSPLMKFDVSRRGSPSRRSSPQLQELAEERLHLQPGERRAQAEVRALPERDVVVGARGRCRSGTGRGTGARRRWPTRGRRPPCRPPRISPAAERRRSRVGGAAERQHGRVHAQHLLDRRRQQRRVGAEPRVLRPGARSSTSTPPGSALRTVSLPAITSRKKNIFSSASVSRSPSTSACTSAVMTSSAGLAALALGQVRRVGEHVGEHARASAGSPASRPAVGDDHAVLGVLVADHPVRPLAAAGRGRRSGTPSRSAGWPAAARR